jgi:hypothetical protein
MSRPHNQTPNDTCCGYYAAFVRWLLANSYRLVITLNPETRRLARLVQSCGRMLRLLRPLSLDRHTRYGGGAVCRTTGSLITEL